MLFLLVFLSTPSEMERYEVISVDSRLTLEWDDHLLDAPVRLAQSPEQLFLLDNKSMAVWAYTYATQRSFFFSGSGEGPGELRHMITGFYLSDETIHIHNANGTRHDTFTNGGALIDSKIEARFSPLYYALNQMRVTKKDGQYQLFSGDRLEASAATFDMKYHGLWDQSSLFETFLLIASEKSNNNTISYVIFDLTEKQVKHGSLVKIQKITDEILPPRIKKGLQNTDMSTFFFNNFQTIAIREDHGFIILEYGLGVFESPNRGPYSIIHQIHPDTEERSVQTLYHRGFAKFSFVIPGKKRWIAFDSGENEILYLTVRQVE